MRSGCGREARTAAGPCVPRRRPIWQQLGAAQPLLGIVTVDQLLKRCALLILPLQEPVQGDAMFQFVLRLNSTGVGSWVARSFPEAVESIPGDAGGIAVHAVATSMLVLAHRRRWHLFWGILLGLMLAAPIGAGLSAIQSALGLPPEILRKLFVAELWSSAGFLVTLWVLLTARGSLWRFPAGLVAASSVSNCLDLVVPPYAAVDYMYSRLSSDWLGLGVFNLADAAYVCGLGLCLLLAIREVLHFSRWLRVLWS